MAEHNLETMSYQRLRCIGERLGIKGDELLDRSELIDAIKEILEERQLDRERINNEVMKLKGKKYDLVEDLNVEAEDFGMYPLPELYVETSVHMLLRDPHWAYVYWNVSPYQLETMKEAHPDSVLVLRIHQFSHPRLPLSKCQEFFDISVREDDASWYVTLPATGSWYAAALVAREEGVWAETLAVSNEIFSPSGYWLERVDELKENERELALFHAAVTDFSGHEVDSVLVKTILQKLEQPAEQHE